MNRKRDREEVGEEEEVEEENEKEKEEKEGDGEEMEKQKEKGETDEERGNGGRSIQRTLCNGRRGGKRNWVKSITSNLVVKFRPNFIILHTLSLIQIVTKFKPFLSR